MHYNFHMKTPRWTNPETTDLISIARAARVTRRDFAARCWMRLRQPAVMLALTSTVRI